MGISAEAQRARRSRPLIATFFLLGVLALSAVVLGTLARQMMAPEPTPPIEGITAVEPPLDIPDFTLTNQHGEPVSLSDLEGKLTLLFFGFTHCPDYCPTTLEEFKRIRQALGDEAGEVQFAFVSVDGARDTPERLRDYLAVRGVDDFVIGLTGPEDTVRQIGAPLGLFFQRSATSAGVDNYLIDHSTVSYLFDRNGHLRSLYSYTTEPDAIAADIRRYL